MRGRAPFEVRPGEKPPPSSDPLALLNYALAHGPEVQIINFAGSVLDAGEAIGTLLVEAPEEVCANLNGPPGEQHAYILLVIDRQAVDAMDEPPLLVLPPLGLVRPS
jgi:hypothetical protein